MLKDDIYRMREIELDFELEQALVWTYKNTFNIFLPYSLQNLDYMTNKLLCSNMKFQKQCEEAIRNCR